MAAVADLYLLDDECWEYVFRFLKHGDDDNRNRDLKSLSIVSKQFLSITNKLRFSITITNPTHHCLHRLFLRFPNLTSLNLTGYFGDVYCSFSSLASSVRLKYTQTSPQLKSLQFTWNRWLCDESIQMLASVFPNLQFLDLSYCRNISEQGIFQVLRRCSNIRHLNLTGCVGVDLLRMNFQVPNLEVLNLSQTGVDDEALYVISKSCRGILQLLLEHCFYVTEKGVKHVVESCTQLREINLRYCDKVHNDVLASLILLRPSLRKIVAPHCYRFSDREIRLLSRQGCIVC